LDLESGAAPTAKPLGVGMQTKPFMGLYIPLKQVVYNAFIAVMVFVITLFGFQYVTSLGAYVSLNFFLPLGVLLRSFYPTRRYGGAILGLAIGFLIVFPFVLSLSNEMLYGKTTSGDAYGIVSGSKFMDQANSFFSREYGPNPDPDGIISNFANWMGNIMRRTWNSLTSGNFADAIKNGFASVFVEPLLFCLFFAIGAVWNGLFISVIMPVFSFYLFAETTKYVAGALGEEVNIFGITRLV